MPSIGAREVSYGKPDLRAFCRTRHRPRPRRGLPLPRLLRPSVRHPDFLGRELTASGSWRAARFVAELARQVLDLGASPRSCWRPTATVHSRRDHPGARRASGAAMMRIVNLSTEQSVRCTSYSGPGRAETDESLRRSAPACGRVVNPLLCVMIGVLHELDDRSLELDE